MTNPNLLITTLSLLTDDIIEFMEVNDTENLESSLRLMDRVLGAIHGPSVDSLLLKACGNTLKIGRNLLLSI